MGWCTWQAGGRHRCITFITWNKTATHTWALHSTADGHATPRACCACVSAYCSQLVSKAATCHSQTTKPTYHVTVSLQVWLLVILCVCAFWWLKESVGASDLMCLPFVFCIGYFSRVWQAVTCKSLSHTQVHLGSAVSPSIPSQWLYSDRLCPKWPIGLW